MVVKESQRAYTYLALFGFPVDLMIVNRVLSEHGARNREEAANEKNLRFSRRERSYGSFVRTLRIPEAVDPSRVSAEFKDGILTVRLPKAKKDQPIQIKVE
jgi:HSP20 family protein